MRSPALFCSPLLDLSSKEIEESIEEPQKSVEQIFCVCLAFPYAAAQEKHSLHGVCVCEFFSHLFGAVTAFFSVHVGDATGFRRVHTGGKRGVGDRVELSPACLPKVTYLGSWCGELGHTDHSDSVCINMFGHLLLYLSVMNGCLQDIIVNHDVLAGGEAKETERPHFAVAWVPRPTRLEQLSTHGM